MRRQVLAAVGAAVCAALFGAAPASGSTATWRVQAVPKPPNSMEVRLFSVSCPSRGSCTAVGFSIHKPISTGGDTLAAQAEHWDGTSWTVQPTPTLRRQATLQAVSCLSATDCTAVGTGGGRAPLAEHWDGTSWTIQPVPFPAGSSNAQPSAVSCASPTSCTAVGVYGEPSPSHEDLPVAEHWDGTSWTVQQIPVPAGAFGADLTGVSCTAGTCTAVGNYNVATTPSAFRSRSGGTEPRGPSRQFPTRTVTS